jgi:geranylgeranyl diphosphate synthase type I
MTTPLILNRARQLVEPELRRAVDTLCAELLLPSRYHFGWVETDGSPSSAGSGKGLRPALAVLSAEAVGAPTVVGLPGAVAVELIHNYSLIHDDIIDGDTERRHRTTVWAAFGVDDAVISGDALHTLAFQVLLADPTPERVAATVRLAEATAAMLAGQAADMAFDDQPVVTLQDCLEMEAGKTGALLGYSASVGAVLAGAPDQQVAALDAYGRSLGLAFQAVDDVLGIWGDPVATGKAAGNDLRERKKSMPVAFVISAGDGAAQELRALYDQPGHLSDVDIERATQIIETAGGRQRTEQEAQTHLTAALAALEGAGLVDESVEELHGLANFVATRNH